MLAFRRLFLMTICFVLLAKVLPIRADEAPEPPPLKYTVSWFGNDFGDGKKWVQMTADAMFVAPDGTCILNTFWDEGGREVGIYKNGDVIGSAGHTHGWGYNGAYAVTMNSKYLFIAQVVDSENGGLVGADTWPAKGKIWFGISRRTLTGGAAPFPGGKGGKGDTLPGCYLPLDEVPVGTQHGIIGLAVNDRQLFVSDSSDNTVKVLDTETMTAQAVWPMPGTRQMTAAPDGTLWVIQSGAAPASAKIVHLAADGRQLPGEIHGIAQPTALAIDRQGRLLVADNGPDQQIKIFDNVNTAPKMVGTFGKKGGIYADPPGRVAPLKFNDISGVGVDKDGIYYICSKGAGLELQAYRPDGALRWELRGLEFVDCGDFDPVAETDIYTMHEHFKMDYTRVGAGKEWRYTGFTQDRFTYPDDRRPNTIFARRIQGKLFLFGTDMYSNFLTIHRQVGNNEIFLPCGYFAKRHDAFPANQPAHGEWIWYDRNGNGAYDATEFDGLPTDAPSTWGWWVDSRGDVWQACENNSIRHFPCLGLDVHHTPHYSYATMKTYPAPAPLYNLQRLEYYPDSDTMYLSGYSKEYPHNGRNWKTIGKVVARYDHWSTNPVKRWEIHPPFDEAQEGSKTYGTPVALSVAGDYLFIAYLCTAEVRIFHTATGAYVGRLQPGQNISGWIDVPYGIRALKRADGEYLVIAEEDWKAKNLLYRWTPTP